MVSFSYRSIASNNVVRMASLLSIYAPLSIAFSIDRAQASAWTFKTIGVRLPWHYLKQSPFGLSLSMPSRALRQAQGERGILDAENVKVVP